MNTKTETLEGAVKLFDGCYVRLKTGHVCGPLSADKFNALVLRFGPLEWTQTAHPLGDAPEIESVHTSLAALSPAPAGEYLTEKEVEDIKSEAWQEGFDEGAAGAKSASDDLFKWSVQELQKRGHLGDCGSEGEEGMFTADDIIQAFYDAMRSPAPAGVVRRITPRGVRKVLSSWAEGLGNIHGVEIIDGIHFKAVSEEIAALQNASPQGGEVSEAMLEAGYDATRDERGMPRFADAGFCLSHVYDIYLAMQAAKEPTDV